MVSQLATVQLSQELLKVDLWLSTLLLSDSRTQRSIHGLALGNNVHIDLTVDIIAPFVKYLTSRIVQFILSGCR